MKQILFETFAARGYELVSSFYRGLEFGERGNIGGRVFVTDFAICCCALCLFSCLASNVFDFLNLSRCGDNFGE